MYSLALRHYFHAILMPLISLSLRRHLRPIARLSLICPPSFPPDVTLLSFLPARLRLSHYDTPCRYAMPP